MRNSWPTRVVEQEEVEKGKKGKLQSLCCDPLSRHIRIPWAPPSRPPLHHPSLLGDLHSLAACEGGGWRRIIYYFLPPSTTMCAISLSISSHRVSHTHRPVGPLVCPFDIPPHILSSLPPPPQTPRKTNGAEYYTRIIVGEKRDCCDL